MYVGQKGEKGMDGMHGGPVGPVGPKGEPGKYVDWNWTVYCHSQPIFIIQIKTHGSESHGQVK